MDTTSLIHAYRYGEPILGFEAKELPWRRRRAAEVEAAISSHLSGVKAKAAAQAARIAQESVAKAEADRRIGLRIQARMAIATATAAGLAALSAGFSGCQAYTAQRALILDAEPVVDMSLDFSNLSVGDNVPKQVRYTLRNHGKSPAVGLRASMGMYVHPVYSMEGYKYSNEFSDPTDLYPGNTEPWFPIEFHDFVIQHSDRLIAGDYIILLTTQKFYRDRFGSQFYSRDCYAFQISQDLKTIVGAKKCGSSTHRREILVLERLAALFR